MRDKGKVKELWLIGGLLVISIAILFGLYGEEPAKGVDLLTKIAFAILVAALTRLLWLGFGTLEKPGDAESFRELGMLRIKKALSDSELKKRLSRARRIRVLKTWFPETPDIEEGLEIALGKPGTELELFLLHPESSILAVRSQGAGKGEDHGRIKVEAAREQLRAWVHEGDNVKVHFVLYDGWPGSPIIQLDDKFLLGFYFRRKSSPRWPWIEIEKESDMGKILEGQFEDVQRTVREEFWLPSRNTSRQRSMADQGGNP